MQEHEHSTAASATQSLGNAWGPWVHDLSDGVEGAEPGVAWVGGGLSLLLWACATLLALQSL